MTDEITSGDLFKTAMEDAKDKKEELNEHVSKRHRLICLTVQRPFAGTVLGRLDMQSPILKSPIPYGNFSRICAKGGMERFVCCW